MEGRGEAPPLNTACCCTRALNPAPAHSSPAAAGLCRRGGGVTPGHGIHRRVRGALLATGRQGEGGGARAEWWFPIPDENRETPAPGLGDRDGAMAGLGVGWWRGY